MVKNKSRVESSDAAAERRLRDRYFAGTFGAVPKVQNSYGIYRHIGSISYSGEKSYGELGPIKNYFPDYDALSMRSWQLYFESEITQVVLNKYATWVIGSGLKLQSEPMGDVLKDGGIKIDAQKFARSVESQFKLYSKSRMSDYSDMQNLNILEGHGFINSKIGGDVLVILRFIDDTIKVQLIDGVHVRSPLSGSEYFPFELKNGNKIINGIEIDNKGQHVAYYVVKDYRTLEYERVAARPTTDQHAMMAFMVYGTRYRLDNYRGMPLMSVVFETIKKLERYKEATVGSAEERQKIAYAIEHDIFSTGEHPLLQQTVIARDIEMSYRDGLVPRDDLGNDLANKIAVTTNKQTFNMALGSHLKSLESKNELYFKDFYTVNIMIICAVSQIPYEVAMAKYDSNYSASRGAMKDWEHTLNVQRANFGFQFMQPIYDAWLEVRSFQRKIFGFMSYINARKTGDRMMMEAVRNARFIGAQVPHIDPEKEVKAVRGKLGAAGDAVPLISQEQAIEELSGGDSQAITEQFAEELRRSNKLGIKIPEKTTENKPIKKPAKKKAA